METFIRIPHASRGDGGSIWRVAQKDMARSLRYIFREKPVVGRIILLVCAFNLFMSSMLIIGLPVILRQTLAVDTLRYGLSQGALAAGGLAGGILAGVLGERLDIRRAHFLLLGCALGNLPWAFRWHWRPRLPAMLLLRYAASC
jgi:predicted MFS family arabinose efflux permease